MLVAEAARLVLFSSRLSSWRRSCDRSEMFCGLLLYVIIGRQSLLLAVHEFQLRLSVWALAPRRLHWSVCSAAGWSPLAVTRCYAGGSLQCAAACVVLCLLRPGLCCCAALPSWGSQLVEMLITSQR